MPRQDIHLTAENTCKVLDTSCTDLHNVCHYMLGSLAGPNCCQAASQLQH